MDWGGGIHHLKFGSLSLTSNLFLSPLAGYTTLPFRLTIRELGGLDLATTDLVNAHLDTVFVRKGVASYESETLFFTARGRQSPCEDG